MNAPWKVAGQDGEPGREALAAFVCDDSSLAAVRQAAEDLGLGATACRKGNLREAVQALAVAASPGILLVDLSGAAAPLNEINALAEVCEPGTLVIAIGDANDVLLYRELLASGIYEYLLKPLAADQLRDTLVTAQATITAPPPQEDREEVNHCAMAVVGTRGGVGASTLATSLAWLFSTEHQLATGLLDLDLHFGTGALALDLEPGRGLADAIENPSRIDGLFIERAMIRANEHLSILSAEAPLSAPLSGDGSAFVRLEEEFRQAFALTVVDLPRTMLVNYPSLLGEVKVVLVATELTLAAARDTIRIVSWLKSNAPQARRLIVANKVPSGEGEISRADFEAAIEAKLAFLVPYDPKLAIQAAKLGQTLAEVARSARTGQILREIAQTVIRRDTVARREPRARAWLKHRFGRLKALRPPKPRK